jgi:hypothetical protein
MEKRRWTTEARRSSHKGMNRGSSYDAHHQRDTALLQIGGSCSAPIGTGAGEAKRWPARRAGPQDVEQL